MRGSIASIRKECYTVNNTACSFVTPLLWGRRNPSRRMRCVKNNPEGESQRMCSLCWWGHRQMRKLHRRLLTRRHGASKLKTLVIIISSRGVGGSGRRGSDSVNKRLGAPTSVRWFDWWHKEELLNWPKWDYRVKNSFKLNRVESRGAKNKTKLECIQSREAFYYCAWPLLHWPREIGMHSWPQGELCRLFNQRRR